MKFEDIASGPNFHSLPRRQFISQVSKWSAGALMAAPLFRIVPQALAAEMTPTLAVAKGTDYEKLVEKALEPLGGISAFVKKGARVVLKPNMSWDRKPEQAANTHPLLVRAMVKLCLQAGASKVTMFDRTCQDMRLCYASCGTPAIVEAMKDSRVTCTFIDDRKFVPVKIQRGKAVNEWEFYKEAIEADCYINMPIAKNHKLATLTLGVKNIMGIIGGKRGQIHQSMPQKLADLNTVLQPKLTIMDATRILLRNGPSGGKMDDVKDLHTITACSDVVATDAYASTLFGLKPDELETTRVASDMGLGQMDLNKVKIVKV